MVLKIRISWLTFVGLWGRCSRACGASSFDLLSVGVFVGFVAAPKLERVEYRGLTEVAVCFLVGTFARISRSGPISWPRSFADSQDLVPDLGYQRSALGNQDLGYLGWQVEVRCLFGELRWDLRAYVHVRTCVCILWLKLWQGHRL